MAQGPDNDDATPQPPQKEAARGWLFGRRTGGNRMSASAAPPLPAKPRKTGLVGIISGLMTVLLVLSIAAAGFFAVARREFSEPGPLAHDKTVIIEKGTGTEEIVDLLDKEGVIARPGLFWAALLWRDLQSKFESDEAAKKRAKAGEYQFKQAITMQEVMEIITSGRSVQHSITIPEGLTSEQIVERLKENDLLSGQVATIPPEGSLLPDTYRINRGTAREALLARMQREHKAVIAEIWARRAKDLPLKAPRDLVILASIVEKETGRPDERPRVAGVFFNRLEKKMRLQSDPTIIYGIIGGKGALGRGLTRAEIDQPTPYNTYQINGLPAGPIANPGRAAMEATANPSRVRDLYFVADGTGGHVFAETLEQHQRNVTRWRQIEAARSMKDATAPDATPAAEPLPEGSLAGPAPVQAPAPNPPANALPPSSARTLPRAASGLRTSAPTPNFDLTTPKTVPKLQ